VTVEPSLEVIGGANVECAVGAFKYIYIKHEYSVYYNSLIKITTIYGKTRQNTGHTPKIKQVTQDQEALSDQKRDACCA
jgi:hypothetical protein